MKLSRTEPPRTFRTGVAGRVEMRDCGRIELEPNEQLTFVTPGGSEYDVARTSWGYYATPSLNARLARSGLRAALVRNDQGRYYVLLVERGHEAAFDVYLAAESETVVCWLDSDDALRRLERSLADR